MLKNRGNIKKYGLFFVLLSFLLVLTSCTSKPEQKPPAQPETPMLQEEPTITLHRTATGANESLKLEEYIKGVVAAEIGDQFPMEALKAQAITARTMTLAKIEYENGVRDKYQTDVSDSHKEFQAYDEKKITPLITQAVDETRGQVVMYNGKYTYTLFHSSSKTKTAAIAEGFPNLVDKVESISDYIVPVEAKGFGLVPDKYKNWAVKVPKSQLVNLLGQKAGDLNDIHVSERGPSGRAITIKAGNASIPAVELRQKLGPDTLFSTDITSIDVQNNFVVFHGDGWGHGCGLEQYGAMEMANEGKTAQEIVLYYYPQTALRQLYQ